MGREPSRRHRWREIEAENAAYCDDVEDKCAVASGQLPHIDPTEGDGRAGLGEMQIHHGDVMTPRMRQVFEFLVARGDTGVREIAENFGLSVETARVYLRQLQQLGRVRRIGRNRKSKWTTRLDPEKEQMIPLSSVWVIHRCR